MEPECKFWAISVSPFIMKFSHSLNSSWETRTYMFVVGQRRYQSNLNIIYAYNNHLLTNYLLPSHINIITMQSCVGSVRSDEWNLFLALVCGEGLGGGEHGEDPEEEAGAGGEGFWSEERWGEKAGEDTGDPLTHGAVTVLLFGRGGCAKSGPLL